MTQSLIPRLQALELDDPTRELADEVLIATGWTLHEEARRDGAPHLLWWMTPDSEPIPDGEQPNPLESIDAADSIADPLLYRSVVTVPEDGELFFRALLWPPGPSPGPGEWDWLGKHKLEAVARTIAGLKARGIE